MKKNSKANNNNSRVEFAEEMNFDSNKSANKNSNKSNNKKLDSKNK